MSEEEIIKLIKEIFEDIKEVDKIYKIELMISGKIKIKYRDKYFNNCICESVLERKKEIGGE
jgi:hypothetical protein